MASKGRKKASLYDLSRERWVPGDYTKIAVELSQGSDRASAIVGGSILENSLTDILNSHFQTMDPSDVEDLFYKPTAPLQTFSAKIIIGHAVGIYGVKMREQLDIIRRIRNAFAHSMRPVEFEDELIARQVLRLREINLDFFEPFKLLLVTYLRARYIANCLDLTVGFENRAHQRAAQKSITIDFPDWSDDEPFPLLHKSTRQHL
jgi:hypothetical protein